MPKCSKYPQEPLPQKQILLSELAKLKASPLPSPRIKHCYVCGKYMPGHFYFFPLS